MGIQSLAGMVGLVTGGASGLGRAAVMRLAKQGVKGLVAMDRQEFPSDYDSSPNLLKLDGVDVTNSDDVARALKETEQKFGRLDFLVNCAGVGIAFKTYNFNKDVPHDLDSFRTVIEINTVGTFNVIRLGVGLIGKNTPNSDGQRGCIINTASVAAFDGQIGQVAYSASKGAIVGMTLPLARDLASQGIRCVTIAPGLFETPLLQSLPDKVKNYLSSLVPNPSRLGLPDEYAHVVQSVLENPMLNGETIRVDGALRMPP